MVVRSILTKAIDGERIDCDQAVMLLKEGDLLELGEAAHDIRCRKNDPEVVTYHIDRNINYTNVCVYSCSFCAFYRRKGDEDAYLLSFEEIGRKVEETLALRGTGILLQGGVHPDLGISFYEDLLSYLRENYPMIHRHAFSPPEIKFIAKKERKSFAEVIERLKKAGLQSIPGGGAEILVDRVRKRIKAFPKCSADEWLEIMETAHNLGLKTTATMMFGAGEEIEDRIEHLRKIRDLQDRTHGFTAFIGWSFQPGNNEMSDVRKATSFEFLKMVAVSRIFLDNFQHIQSSWLTQGKKVGQIALRFGADDMGSIMIEENVVSAAGLCYKMSREEMEYLILSAGFKPLQRSNLYDKYYYDTEELDRISKYYWEKLYSPILSR